MSSSLPLLVVPLSSNELLAVSSRLVISRAMPAFKTSTVLVLVLVINTVLASQKLPVFFFHGSSGNIASGANFAANLTAEDRVFNALSFCKDLCSVEGLNLQIPLAIAQIRSIIAANPKTYASGYIFIGHSQGGTIARAVIEEMDDHKVTKFISLAGAQNGNFYGPQTADMVPLYMFLQFATSMIPASVFDFSTYPTSEFRGKAQYDFNQLLATTPSLGSLYSAADLYRSPFRASWLTSNPFLPVYNNINSCKCNTICSREQARRKTNFLKLKNAYFFASPRDGVISPYQSSILGQYSEVTSATQIQTNFESLHVLPMTSTVEYTSDTYGLKTLDRSGRLHLFDIAAVAHECWIEDTVFFDNQNEYCFFQTNYDKYVYPLLQ